MELQGQVFEVEDGWVYEVVNQDREPIFCYYNPDFVAHLLDQWQQPLTIGQRLWLCSGTHRSYSEDLENGNTIADLIGPSPANWTSMTLQSPAVPTVQDYVTLRRLILTGQRDFIDNRIEIPTSPVRAGDSGLRFYAVEPTGGLDHTKTSLDYELVYFQRGDTFRFTGWFYIEQGRPDSILDLESSYIDEAPGIRIILDDERRPYVELKFATKPIFRVKPPNDNRFPVDQWVKIELKLYLSDEDSEGRVEFWMTEKKIIDRYGRTLTMFDAVYKFLRVGIKANSSDSAVVLHVDELSISDAP